MTSGKESKTLIWEIESFVKLRHLTSSSSALGNGNLKHEHLQPFMNHKL
jgi:hypothetical protein